MIFFRLLGQLWTLISSWFISWRCFWMSWCNKFLCLIIPASTLNNMHLRGKEQNLSSRRRSIKKVVECFMCSVPLPGEKNRRRIQSSDVAYSMLQNQLKAVDDAVKFPLNSVLCRPCTRRLEKLKKLQSECSGNESKIQSQLSARAALLPRSQDML